MRSFIVIGSSNRNSANHNAVFREIAEGSVAGAHYLGIDALFRGSSLLYRAATNRRLRAALKKLPPLGRLYERAVDALYRRGRSVNLRSLRALLPEGGEGDLIFCPGTRIDRLSASILQFLRARLPGCRLVFYLVDSIERTAYMNDVDVPAILDYLRMFDAAYTYDRADAETYPDAVRFIEIPLWRSRTPPPPQPESELYFCGHDKNRRELLLAIYRRLTDAGLRCRYRVVTSVKQNQRKLGVTLSEWTPYEVTVDELIRSNCVLEILAEHNRESTLRYREAVMYNKKFLTTNPAIDRMPYYDPRWMRTFRTAEDIDLDWLRAVEPVNYGYRGDYSAETFLRRVEELTPPKKA